MSILERCSDCIYETNCPCMWSKNCAACLTIQKRSDKVDSKNKECLNNIISLIKELEKNIQVYTDRTGRHIEFVKFDKIGGSVDSDVLISGKPLDNMFPARFYANGVHGELDCLVLCTYIDGIRFEYPCEEGEEEYSKYLKIYKENNK